MRAPGPGQRGFTLFELLVVIVLVGVATSILAVGIGRGLLVANERSALAHMVSALRSARVQAIASGRPVRATFDLRARQVQAPGRPPQAWPEDLGVRLQTARGLGAAFEFYPDGAASGGNILISRGQARWRIGVSWLTGSVQLQALP
ncbi:Type II secretion system protein H [Pseudomonas reidholzensis]|uniref:Type II secretion system protein H n=1 Tax=Pseudomonas reidholzensis TaxID=1785162 RepID=A0A383RZF8_9PSED|nr:GspH/FimT family pseudopilin [Pseudomonas reidholzensis]SYX91758.1 Type II secretion system protein H [Pseudomonas reidholzensis]